MTKYATPRHSRPKAFLSNNQAVGIMSKIIAGPQSEIGKSVWIPLTSDHLPELRRIVSFLEAKDDC